MKTVACLLALLMVVACASKPPAPVVDRSQGPPAGSLQADGRYRVRQGDTLHAIAFRFGLDHRDVADWNDIRPPYVIFPDQMLRLIPLPATASTRKPPAGPAPGKVSSPGSTTSRNTPKSTAPDSRPGPAANPPATSVGDGPKGWLWPAKGRLLRSFSPTDPARNGVDIAGTEGQDVVSTAAGRVVYSGNGLIGYGELIIVKHSERMLSAYAHNRVRLVGEGDVIRAGQKIAEMGRNDRNEQILHFEIRENGRPVNPLNYLPRQ